MLGVRNDGVRSVLEMLLQFKNCLRENIGETIGAVLRAYVLICSNLTHPKCTLGIILVFLVMRSFHLLTCS